MAEHWELGVGASYGAASVTKLNIICMGTVDYLGIKMQRKKETVKRQSTPVIKTSEEYYTKKYLL